jgi:hypothetical protein
MKMKFLHFILFWLQKLGMAAKVIGLVFLTTVTQQAVSAEPDLNSEVTEIADARQPAVPPTTELTILAPTSAAIVDITSTNVVVKFPINQQVELSVNGIAINPSLVGRTETNKTNRQVTQTWYGVPLQEGDNIITAKTLNNDKVGQTASVQVQVRGTPKHVTIDTLETRVPADGRSTVTIQGQLLDANKNRNCST